MQQFSLIKRTRREKLAAMAAGLAISIARERNDPAYVKHQLYKSKFVEMKKKIFARYRVQALRLAKMKMRQSMMGDSTQNREPAKQNN